MPRYKLTIEYDGRPFVGWQIQDDGPSVQGVLAAAVEAFCGEKVSVHGAGRTDAGVHALGQVGHLDLGKEWEEDTVRDALNAHLRPHPVAVIKAERAHDGFDARFSAIKRHYLYRIVNRRAGLTFQRGCAWRIAKPGALGGLVGAGLGAAGGAIADGGSGAGKGALIGGLIGAGAGTAGDHYRRLVGNGFLLRRRSGRRGRKCHPDNSHGTQTSSSP